MALPSFLMEEIMEFLFNSNNRGALCDALMKYSKLKQQNEMKKKLKKNAKKYTLFYHYLKLIEIIRN